LLAALDFRLFFLRRLFFYFCCSGARRSGRSEVGNVQFALDHVVAAAVAKFQALVEAEETPKE
jgi:hypothetical protein